MQFEKFCKEMADTLTSDGLIVEEDNNEADSAIIELFEISDKVSRADIEGLSEISGIPVEKLEQSVYDLLTSLLNSGLAIEAGDDFDDFEYDPDQLEMGTKVEFEHTSNEYIAQRIAKDHLVECPDYYTRLAEMEKECEK